MYLSASKKSAIRKGLKLIFLSFLLFLGGASAGLCGFAGGKCSSSEITIHNASIVGALVLFVWGLTLIFRKAPSLDS